MKISRTGIAAALASAVIATSALSVPASSALNREKHPEQEISRPTSSQAGGSPADAVLLLLERLIPITSRVVKFF